MIPANPPPIEQRHSVLKIPADEPVMQPPKPASPEEKTQQNDLQRDELSSNALKKDAMAAMTPRHEVPP